MTINKKQSENNQIDLEPNNKLLNNNKNSKPIRVQYGTISTFFIKNKNRRT